MPRKASGETYVWNPVKEKKFLEKLDEYLQTTGGLGYDPVTDRVICSDKEWKSFVQVHKECKHLKLEGLRNKELYYSVFDKYNASGASGYGSVTMPDENLSYFDFDASMDNLAYRPIFEEDGTPTTGPRNLNNMQSGGYAGPSRSRGSSGKRKVRDEADEMTIQAMQEIVTHFRGGSQSGASNEQSSQTDHMLRFMNIMIEMESPPAQRTIM
ncbi:hypothetical protein TIFTF001_043145 [Ficus carica]|uniref:Myb/SANT-like domain-containing protein n=1 Tax=Ficus carica TaxID=3494 RepID=A0AA87YQU3_FICCA|nr:hypothetical protein TIFTF001_043145 [Ficus carica]